MSNLNNIQHTNKEQKSKFPNIPLFGGNGGESRIRRSAKLNEALKSNSNNREQQQQERSHLNIRAAKIGNHTNGNKPTAESDRNSNEHVSSAPSFVPLPPPGGDIPSENAHNASSAATDEYRSSTCNGVAAGIPVATAIQDDVESLAQNNNNVLIVHARIIPDGRPLRRKILCSICIVFATIILVCVTTLMVIFYALGDSMTLPSPTSPPTDYHSISPSAPPSQQIASSSSAPSYLFTNNLLESSRWKLVVEESQAEVTYLWDVVELELYSDYDCTSSFKLDLTDGEPIDSMHYSGSGDWGPENAFDGDVNSRWGGRQDATGRFWIGIDFVPNTLRVRCIKLTQFGGNHANELSLQNYREKADRWETVLEVKDLYNSGWNETDRFGDILNVNTISLSADTISLAPSMNPTQTPSASPTFKPSSTPLSSGYGKELTTTFSNNNVGSGNMFDVVALLTISIREFDIHLKYDGSEVEVEIYGKSGSLNGFEMDASAWSLIGSTMVVSQGESFRTQLPPNLLAPVNLEAGTTHAFGIIVTTGPAMLYTDGISQGSVYMTVSHMQLLEGVGLGGSMIGPSTAVYSPRVWNGAIRYNIGSDSRYTAYRLLATFSQTERGLWDVNEIDFYTDVNCTPGSKIELSGFDAAIDSAHYELGGSWGPENAFDDNVNSKWGGRQDYKGNLWVGAMIMDEMNVGVDVRCVKLGQSSGNHANEASVWGFCDETGQWESILDVNDLYTSGWNETDVHGDIVNFNTLRLPSLW